MKTADMTKEKLVKENVILQQKYDYLEYTDIQTRKTFTRLLGNYVNSSSTRIFRIQDSETPIMNWTEIAYHIGELRADADIHCLIEARDNFRRRVEELENEKKEDLL